MHIGNSIVSTIPFTGISSLSVANLPSFQLTSPGGVTGVAIGDPTAGVSQISGTSAGSAFAPVSFNNVTAVTVMTASDTNDDTVTIQSGGLGATGLQSFAVDSPSSGNNMLLDYNDSFNLPVANGTFSFTGGSGNNTLVGPNPPTPVPLPPTTVTLTKVATTIPVPVIVIPGFTASFATAPNTAAWFTNIGLPFSEMELDPIENTYVDLVNSLKSTGYATGLTLFQAPWDWRLPLAPQDGTIDGMLSDLTVSELTGGTYNYAVDYLGTALVQAASAWSAAFDNRSLPAVDVITHSTGALIARAYVQSPSYGQTSNGVTLPEFNDAVMIAPPNQGAPQTWNLLNNNYSESMETRGVSLIIGDSYAWVLAGHTITTPNPNNDITLSSITVNRSPSIQQFLLQYAPSLEDLLPTYPFLDTGSGTLTVGTSDLYNKLLFDLNDGYGLTAADLPAGLSPSIIPANPDPNMFLDDPSNEILGKLDVIYSSTESTADEDVQESPTTPGSIVPLGSIFSEQPTETWYMQQDGKLNGDGTLTLTSTVGQFGDPRFSALLNSKVFLQQLTGGSFIHAQIPSNVTAQEEVLGDLGQSIQANGKSLISSGNSHFDPGYVLKNVLSLLPHEVLSYDGLTFDASNLAVAEDASMNIFTLTGSASLTIPVLGTIDINLSGPGNGLVMTGEQFTSFGATLTTSSLTIGGLTINSDGLELSYQAPTGNETTGDFVITGDADFELGGQTVDVALGGNGTQGLVIQNGQFESLDMTVDSAITVGGLSFTSQGLNFTYDTATSEFTMTGDAGVALGDNSVSLDFGGGSTQGLVVKNGSLSSFDASITSSMSVAGVTLGTNGLTLDYDTNGDQFSVGGDASVSAGGVTGMEVTFGSGGNPGLVISGGALESLDLSVTSSFTVQGVTVAANNLEFTYTAANGPTPATFGLAGSTMVSTADAAFSLDVTFGNGPTPGLVISGGAIATLDMIVTGSFTVDSVSFAASNLALAYSEAASTWSLSGSATVTTADQATSLGVMFGYTDPATGVTVPGLVIAGGDLTSLNMTVSTSFSVANVSFAANALDFDYTAQTKTFTLSGSTTLTTADDRINLDVAFGYTDPATGVTFPGLVITGGDLTSLDLTVNGQFSVDSVGVQASNLQFTYAATPGNQPPVFTLGGTALAKIGGMGNLSVTFGHDATPGLVISGGDLSSLDMTVGGGFTLGGAQFAVEDLQLVFSAGATPAGDVFTLAGSATASIQRLGNLSLKFGHDGAPGLVENGGVLSSLDLSVSGQFTVGSVTVTATDLQFEYVAKTATFSMAGTAGVNVGGVSNLDVTFGYTDPTTGVTFAGLVVTPTAGTAKLQSLDMTVNTNFEVDQVTFQATNLHLSYAASTSSFNLTGAASLDVTDIGNLAVTFGQARSSGGVATPGLSIVNGSLSSLNMTVQSNITVGAVSFTTTRLNFTYTANPSSFSLAGSAVAQVSNIANLGVTFGQGKTPGLVVSGGALTNLNMTVDSNFQLGGVTFTSSGLNFNYDATGAGSFSMSGTAGVQIGKMDNLTATFGAGGAAGLVLTGNSLSSLDMTINSNFKVAGVTFTASGLNFDFNASGGGSFSMAGTAGVQVGGVDNLTVIFGAGGNTGLMITGGSLSSLDMTINATFDVAAVAFNATDLNFMYTASSNSFSMSGSVGATVAGIDGLTVTFGAGGTPGLVISGGNLSSLNMTINSTFDVAAVAFNATNLNFTYTAATDSFSMSGSVGVTVAGIDGLTVTFGGGGTPGLVITGGDLVSLDMTINATFDVAAVAINATNLNFNYVAATDSFSMAGTVGVTVAGIDGLSVTFGDKNSDPNTDPADYYGLVIQGGELQSLNMFISAEFRVAAVKFEATDLNFDYVAKTDTFSMAGTVGVTVGGFDGLSVTFGDANADPITDRADHYGLIIQAGQLQSLNMFINAEFKVGTVIVSATNLNFDYVASTDTFSMAGTVGVSVKGIDSLSVTLGDKNASPIADPADYYGLIIQNGSLVSLNMIINTQFKVGNVIVSATNLQFDYVTATNTFSMAGSVGVQVIGIDNELSATFGDAEANPQTDPADYYGLIIQNDQLQSLNLFINARFTVDAVTFYATNLEFDYVAATNTFSMAGTVGVTILGLDNLSVTFGDQGADPQTDAGKYYGIIVNNGTLTQLDASVNANFSVDGTTIFAKNLDFDYTHNITTGVNTFTLTGTAGVDLPADIGEVDVTFGANGDPGVVVTDGTLTSLDMTLSANISIAGLNLAQANFVFTYTASSDEFTLNGTATASIAVDGVNCSLAVDLGGTTPDGTQTQGMLVQNGVLETLNMTIVGNFSIASLNLSSVNFVMTYEPASYVEGVYTPAEFIMAGTASLNLYNVITVNIDLGHNGQPGLLVENGALETLDFSLESSINFLSDLTANLDVSANYSNSTGILDIKGNAGLSLNWSVLPGWMHPFWGGTLSLGTLGFEIYVNVNNESSSYVDFWASIVGEEVGVEIGFNGDISLSFGDPRQVIPFTNAPWDESLDALAQAYQAASSSLGSGYNITGPELEAYENQVTAQAAATAIALGQEDNWGYRAALVGELRGATAFYDPTGTGVYRAGDPTATTEASGGFNLSIPSGATGGEIVVTGGTDLATGLPNALVLTAPFGTTQVNPYTTLLDDLTHADPGLTESSAISEIDQAFGLPAIYDFTQEDYVDGTLSGSNIDAAAFAGATTIAAEANLVVGLLGGSPGAPSAQILGSEFFSSLASMIDASGGTLINFGNASEDQALLQATLNASRLLISPDAVAGTADVMAAVGGAIGAQPPGGTAAFMTSVVQIQTLAEGTIAPALAAVGSGTTDISTVEGDYTESTVETLASSVAIGQLAEPAVSISSVVQTVGPGSPSTFQFTVSLTGMPSLSSPVSIAYRTVDGSATAANGAYTTESGTLTWAAGDTSPRTISVPVTGVMPASDEYFLVELSNPVNTEVQEANGVGEILSYTEISTTTTLAASTLSTPGQANVTLTAVVTNHDRSSSPGTGQVTFYDGSTVLGTSTLDSNGTATLSTSFITLGSRTLTAVYGGYQVVGTVYDPGTSPAVTETVTPAIQTITFAAVSAQTYGATPITVDAESSLSLPVSLSVISGPGTLVGDVLTITGAGTIVVQATQPGDSFTAAATPVDLSIAVAPAPLTIAAGYQTVNYGAAYPSLYLAYHGFVNSDSAASLTTLPTLTTAPAASDAGTYAINVSEAVDPNYVITYKSGALTIAPALLTVLPACETAMYGAAYPTLSATLLGAIGNDLATLESELSLSTAPAGSGVGSYDIDASGITDPNYSVSYGTGALTIMPVPLVITAKSLSASYGSVPALTVSYSGLVNGDSAASLTVPPSLITSPAGSSVGTYTITATGAVDPNYAISYVPGTLTITQAPLIITADNQTITYGQPIPTLTALYSGLTGGDSPGSLAVQPTISLPGSPTDPGSYTISVTGAVDANYSIGYVPGTLTINPDATTTTITPSLIETLAGQDVVFTATITALSTGLPVTDGSVQFRVDGQDVGSPVPVGASGEATLDPGPLALGPHTVSAAFSGTDDFQASSQSSNEFVYQNQTTTQISQSDEVANYGDTVTFTATVAAVDSSAGTPAGSVQFEIDDQPSGSPVLLDATGTASLSLSTVNGGTHTITAVYLGEGSIFEGGEASTTLQVMPIGQAIDFGPLATVTYGAAPFALGATASSGLAVTYSIISGPATLDGSSLTITGAGTVVIESDQAGDNDYLAASSVQEALLVDPAMLTITANNQTEVYDAALPALTVSYSGFVNGDSASSLTTLPTVGTTATVGSHVAGGPYEITASGATDPNYMISYVDGALTVTSAPLTITADNQTMTYGGSMPALTASFSGLVNGDTPATFATTPDVAPTASTVPATSHAGTYAITVSGASDPDYSISCVAGTLTIAQASLTIAANDQTNVYGATVPALSVSYSGLVNDDTPSSLMTAPTVMTTATAGSHVTGNPYPITASGAVDPDYTIAYVAGSLTVTPAPLVISTNNQTMSYGGSMPALSVSYTRTGQWGHSGRPLHSAECRTNRDHSRANQPGWNVRDHGGRCGGFRLRNQLRQRLSDDHPGGTDDHGE